MRRYTPILAMVALMLSLAGCDKPKEPDQAASRPPPAVGVIEVAAQPVQQGNEFVGRVVAINKVDLLARVEGFLEQRSFTEGQDVTAGQPLFTIEKDQFQAQLDQANADLASAQAVLSNAQIQYQRAFTLGRSQNIPQATVDQRKAEQDTAQAKVEQAQAAVRELQINLGYTNIVAPVAGQIGRANVTEGNLVGPSTGVLATIVSMDPIYITFPVAQSIVQKVQQSSRKVSELQVKVKLADGTVYDQTGSIDFIDNQVDQATDSVTVRAVIANPERLLKDGQIANTLIELATPEEQLVVPQAAVLVDQVGSYVLVVGTDSKVEQRRITPGAQQGVYVAVLDGLKPGEQVIVDGLQKVRPGQAVKASPTKVMGA